MKRSRELVAAVLRELPTSGMDDGSVVDALKILAKPAGPTNWQLPEGMSAEGFLDHLIHQGILQPAGKGLLTCPIPSMRTWLIDRGKPCSEQIFPAHRNLSSSEHKRGRIALGAVAKQVLEEKDQARRSNQEKDNQERDAGAER